MDVIDAIGNTPLIELRRVAAGLPVKVFIKCEHLNPGGSIKDRTAVVGIGQTPFGKGLADSELSLACSGHLRGHRRRRRTPSRR